MYMLCERVMGLPDWCQHVRNGIIDSNTLVWPGSMQQWKLCTWIAAHLEHGVKAKSHYKYKPLHHKYSISLQFT